MPNSSVATMTPLSIGLAMKARMQPRQDDHHEDAHQQHEDHHVHEVNPWWIKRLGCRWFSHSGFRRSARLLVAANLDDCEA